MNNINNPFMYQNKDTHWQNTTNKLSFHTNENKINQYTLNNKYSF